MNTILLRLSATDARLLHAFVLRRRRPLDLAMRVLTLGGDPRVVIPITLALIYGAWPSAQDAGVLAGWSLAVSHGFVQLLKRTISRPRPQYPLGRSLIVPEDRFSFPSGHAAAALSVGLPLFLALSGPLAAALLLVCLLVGVSRCYLGVHYPGDIVAGWSLAALTVAGFAFLLDFPL